MLPLPPLISPPKRLMSCDFLVLCHAVLFFFLPCTPTPSIQVLFSLTPVTTLSPPLPVPHPPTVGDLLLRCHVPSDSAASKSRKVSFRQWQASCCAGLFKIARQMYLLFQQQTTLERAASDNDMWGPFSEEQPHCLKAFSLLRMFGPTTCLVAPDSRAGVIALLAA